MLFQGAIVAILDSTGTAVIQYKYDAWSKPISKTGSMAGTLGTVQPFRYRGYVYDEEIGLYYLETRFYSAYHCRFINSDLVYYLGQDHIIGTFNLFIYCCNNPTILKDSSGLAFETIWDAISLGASVVEVIGNPFDPWAWIGLAGDAADLLIPFVGGIGETTRALKAASNAAELLDNAADASKATRKGWQVGQDITSLTRAGNTPSWSTVRSRYWKNKALYFPEEYVYSGNGIDNLARMRAGKAPLFGTGDDAYSMELHHMLGREGDNYYLFFEVSPEDHAKIDPFRHTGK